MAFLPLRASDINRLDYQQLLASVISQRGDAVEIVEGSVMYVECQAIARLLYNLRMQNDMLQNQFDFTKMVDPFLTRWENFLNILPLPNQTLTDRQNSIAFKLSLAGKTPTIQVVTDMLASQLSQIFVDVVTTSAADAVASIPGGSNIVGGSDCKSGGWSSTVAEIVAEFQKPAWMSYNMFQNLTANLYLLFNNFLPSYTNYNWMWNGFSDDGYAAAQNYVATISIASGSTSLIGHGTAWHTPINALDGSYNINPNTVIEAYDDTGVWRRMVVNAINSDTSISLLEAVEWTITNKPYRIQGFFLDCNSSEFPYPPAGCKNLDNAGLGSTI